MLWSNVEVFSLKLCFMWTFVTAELKRPRGVAISKASLYQYDKDFTCFDGSHAISFGRINDDYCDCEDGSDEPGTSACANGSFHCTNTGYKHKYIPSSRVNDGICDCCDGTDEYTGKITCANYCRELGKAYRDEMEKKQRLEMEGHELYKEYAHKGQEAKTEKQARLQSIKSERDELHVRKIELEKLKDEAEVPEKAAKEKFQQDWEEEKARNQADADTNRSLEAFADLDYNKDNVVNIEEMTYHREFDIDANGEVSKEEAREYLEDNEQVDYEMFFERIWPHIREIYRKPGEKNEDIPQIDPDQPIKKKKEPEEEFGPDGLPKKKKKKKRKFGSPDMERMYKARRKMKNRYGNRPDHMPHHAEFYDKKQQGAFPNKHSSPEEHQMHRERMRAMKEKMKAARKARNTRKEGQLPSDTDFEFEDEKKEDEDVDYYDKMDDVEDLYKQRYGDDFQMPEEGSGDDLPEMDEKMKRRLAKRAKKRKIKQGQKIRDAENEDGGHMYHYDGYETRDQTDGEEAISYEDEGEDVDEDDKEMPEEEEDKADEEKVKMPDYDPDTKALIEAAAKARAEFDETEKQFNSLDKEISELNRVLDLDMGFNHEHYPLRGECYEYTDREYTYTLCPFDKASQKSKHGGMETTLGRWGHWSGSDTEKYSKQKYDNGQMCWNGPDRTCEVHISCGVKTELLGAREPNRCEYAFDFKTPAACSSSEFKGKELDPGHDEL